MNETPRAVWQVSGGHRSRSYVDLFLRHGVALVGPGDAGAWSPERDDEEFDGVHVRRFAEAVQPGDAILLRTGAATIAAIGLAEGEYIYLERFDDVNGLDLQHTRRVRWCELPEHYVFASAPFGARPSRFSRVHDSSVVDFVRRFVASPPIRWQVVPLPDLPPQESPLDEIPGSLQPVVGEAQDLLTLFANESRFGERPTEDELVGHLVLPFVRALGWPPERVGVKWNRIDVALFSSLPRTTEHCAVVVEAKRLGAGVEGALSQALGYVEALGVPRDVVVTDGLRYRMYLASDDYAPVAYANLGRLKRSATRLFDLLGAP